MNFDDLPYGEDVNYWQSGQGSPDTWIDRTVKLIESVDGYVHQEGFMRQGGVACFMLEFTLGPDRYRVVYPVLPSKKGNTSAARRQAATMLYHDVKQRVVNAKVFGVKDAFLQFLLLEDGQTVSYHADSNLLGVMNNLLPAHTD